MPWLRIDDGFAEHPKVMDLSDRAFRLHVAALCYCAKNLTDGYISDQHLRVISAIVTTARTSKQVFELAASGLWIPEDDGYRIKDFLEYNPDSESVKEERRKARDRMAAIRAFKKSSPEHPANSERSSGEVRAKFADCSPSPSRPVPTPNEKKDPKAGSLEREGWEDWELTTAQVEEVLGVSAEGRKAAVEQTVRRRPKNRAAYFLRCCRTRRRVEDAQRPRELTPEERLDRLARWDSQVGRHYPDDLRVDELRRMGATDHDIQQIVREAA